MSTLVENENLNHNEFLVGFEEWSEENVARYKKKVAGQVIYGYFTMALGYLFTMLVGSVVAGLLLGIVIELGIDYLQVLVWAAQMAVTFFAFFWYGIRKIRKFMKENHGEVGHEGNPLYKQMSLHRWITLGLTVAFTAWTLLAMIGDSFFENFSASMMFTAIPLASCGYFFGAVDEMWLAPKCPICGRFHTVSKMQVGKYGDKVDGQREMRQRVTEQTGTRTRTTYWSDGSTTSSSSPIYSTVTKVTVYDEHSVLCDYVKACSECTYHAEGTEKQHYSVRVGEYTV